MRNILFWILIILLVACLLATAAQAQGYEAASDGVDHGPDVADALFSPLPYPPALVRIEVRVYAAEP